MRTMEIKKKSGGVRKIYIPSRAEKSKLRKLLAVIPQPEDKLVSAHGFRTGRSPVTNALAHVKNHVDEGIMISCDLSDFFRHVREADVASFLPFAWRKKILTACFVDGAAQQGLSTSPALANLAGIAIDEAIRRKIDEQWHGAEYTRYADDLSLSFPVAPSCGTDSVIACLEEIVEKHGQIINKKKTRIQLAKSGRWECCGVMVDRNGIYISRRQRRELRVAEHRAKTDPTRKNRYRAGGLREWAQLKIPLTAEEKLARRQIAA